LRRRREEEIEGRRDDAKERERQSTPAEAREARHTFRPFRRSAGDAEGNNGEEIRRNAPESNRSRG
jgi:hypothetical protein